MLLLDVLLPGLSPVAASGDWVQSLLILLVIVGGAVANYFEEKRKKAARQKGSSPGEAGGPARRTHLPHAENEPDVVWGDHALRNPPASSAASAVVSGVTGFTPAPFESSLGGDASDWAEAAVGAASPASVRRKEMLARLGIKPGEGVHALQRAVLWREVLGPPKGARNLRHRW